MSVFRFFRLGTYLVSLGLLALAAFWMKPQYASIFPPLETWSMILGYLAYVLIGATLLIGPVRSWLPARWTAFCMYLRRDLGILAGWAALLHVVLVLILFSGEHRLLLISAGHEQADGVMGMFFASFGEAGWLFPNWSIIGIANYLGLTAFLILLCLWLTSSDKATKWLGVPTWKRLHLANPFLFVLVVFHGLTYIQSIKGHPHTFADILWLAAVVWVVRGISFVRTIGARHK